MTVVKPVIKSSLVGDQESIVRAVYQYISGNEVQGARNVVIEGAAHLGKSNIIAHLFESKMREKYLHKPKWLQLLYYDGANKEQDATTIFRKWGKQLIYAIDNQWDLKSHPLIDGATEKLMSDDAIMVRTGLSELLQSVDRLHNRYCVFVIDHFEALLELLSADEIQYLRDNFSNSRHGLVVTVSRPIDKLTPKTFPSKFHEIFFQQNVTGLSLSQADDVLSSYGLRYNDKQEILSYTGTHPFMLRIVADEMEKHQGGPDEVSVDSVVNTIRSDMEAAFQRIWGGLDERLKIHLYNYLSHKVNASEIMTDLRKLEGKGLLYRHRGNYEVSGSLFRDFVLTQPNRLNHLLKVNFFELTLQNLKSYEKKTAYHHANPSYYYQFAFDSFSSPSPDYQLINSLLFDAYDRVLNLLIHHVETKRGEFYSGRIDDFNVRLEFISSGLEIDMHMKPSLETFWTMCKQQDSIKENVYDTQSRFYTFAGIIQYLLHASEIEPSSPGDSLSFEHVAVGGAGIVSKYYHEQFKREIAVKQPKHQNSDSIEQLYRSARIQLDLLHPNIARIYGVKEDKENGVFIEMEWIEGPSLHEKYIDPENRVSEKSSDEILAYILDVANGLVYAHTQNIIHRDIKPKNIILNSKNQAIIIDFDIAHADTEDTIHRPDTQARLTPSFAAPEQFANSGYSLSPKADVFSLGVVLYLLLTEQFPYEAGNNALAYMGTLPVLEEHEAVPVAVYDLLKGMLAWNPTDRLTAKETVSNLTSIINAEKA